MRKLKNQKASKEEIFDYIVRMEAMNRVNYGVSGIYPTTRQICLVFDLSRERANWYIRELERRTKQNLRLKKYPRGLTK